LSCRFILICSQFKFSTAHFTRSKVSELLFMHNAWRDTAPVECKGTTHKVIMAEKLNRMIWLGGGNTKLELHRRRRQDRI